MWNHYQKEWTEIDGECWVMFCVDLLMIQPIARLYLLLTLCSTRGGPATAN